jgi:hypothetical protein
MSRFRVLVAHFFGRFFDKESLSPQADAEANVAGTLALLTVPGAFLSILLMPLRMVAWDLAMGRCFFLTYSLAIMGLVMVVEWNMLFPDRRDYLILTPLPLRAPTLFLAKLAAFAIFMGLFATAVNSFLILFWPAIDAGVTLAGWGAHALVLLAGGVFIALAAAALNGLLVTLLPAKAFRRASVCLQTVLMSALVMTLVLSPWIGGAARRAVETRSAWLDWLPSYWFLGLYERLYPGVHSATLAGLAPRAVEALAAAASLFLLTYLPGYWRHSRRAVELPDQNRAGRGWIRRRFSRLLEQALLRHPVQRAAFHFISQTITRSARHRLFLACYSGFGIALAILSLGASRSGLLPLSLTLSFVLVSGLRAAFNFPSELKANWAFQMTGADSLLECFAATRKWIVVCGIVPLFALLAIAELAFFRWWEALFHLAYGVALSLILIEVMFAGFRKVPFTCSYSPGKVNVAGLGALYIFGFTAYGLVLASVEEWLLDTPAAAVAFFALAAAGWAALRRWHGRELAFGALDYEGAIDPVVRTLDLPPMGILGDARPSKETPCSRSEI